MKFLLHSLFVFGDVAVVQNIAVVVSLLCLQKRIVYIRVEKQLKRQIVFLNIARNRITN